MTEEEEEEEEEKKEKTIFPAVFDSVPLVPVMHLTQLFLVIITILALDNLHAQGQFWESIRPIARAP